MPDLSQHGPVVLQIEVPLLAAVHEASAPQQGLQFEVGLVGDGQAARRGTDLCFISPLIHPEYSVSPALFVKGVL